MNEALPIRIQSEIDDDIREIDGVLQSGVLSADRLGPPFTWALRTLFIGLRDLMKKSEEYAGKAIDFTDDVIQSENPKVENIADLVRFMRNAAGHPESDHHMAAPNVRDTFGRCWGLVGAVARDSNGNVIIPGCDYEDDVSFGTGRQRIYLKRHILRAFEEAKVNLLPLCPRIQSLPR